MNKHIYGFEKLNVWKKSREFVKNIYDVTQFFPDHEKYGLTNQIRRAAVSITANIAEGSSRMSLKDQANFSQLSYSSLMELLSHLYLANDLGFINEDKLNQLKIDIYNIAELLSTLRKSQITRYNLKSKP